MSEIPLQRREGARLMCPSSSQTVESREQSRAAMHQTGESITALSAKCTRDAGTSRQAFVLYSFCNTPHGTLWNCSHYPLVAGPRLALTPSTLGHSPAPCI